MLTVTEEGSYAFHFPSRLGISFTQNAFEAIRYYDSPNKENIYFPQ